jgi:hypothetical protein
MGKPVVQPFCPARFCVVFRAKIAQKAAQYIVTQRKNAKKPSLLYILRPFARAVLALRRLVMYGCRLGLFGGGVAKTDV